MKPQKQANYYLVLNNKKHCVSRETYNDGIIHEERQKAMMQKSQEKVKEKILERMKEITKMKFEVSTFNLKLHDVQFTLDGGIKSCIPEFDQCIEKKQHMREVELIKCMNLAFKRWINILRIITEEEHKKLEKKIVKETEIDTNINEEETSSVFEEGTTAEIAAE